MENGHVIGVAPSVRTTLPPPETRKWRGTLDLVGCSLLMVAPWLAIYPDVMPNVCCWNPGTPAMLLKNLPGHGPQSVLARAGILFPHLWVMFHTMASVTALWRGPSWLMHHVESGLSVGGLALAHIGLVLAAAGKPAWFLEESAVHPTCFLGFAAILLTGIDLSIARHWRRAVGPLARRGRTAALCCCGWFALWLSLEFTDTLLQRLQWSVEDGRYGDLEMLWHFALAFPGTILAFLGAGVIFLSVRTGGDPHFRGKMP